MSLPKPDDERVRRNIQPTVYNTTKLRWDGLIRGPELGDCPLPNAVDGYCGKNVTTRTPGVMCRNGNLKCDGHPMWSPRTVQWWEKWRRSPQSMVMSELDWEFLLETAVLHHMLWSPRGNAGGVSQTQLASELRQRVAKFGATFEDRRKLQMSIETPQTLQADQDARDDLEGGLDIDYEAMLKEG